MTIYIFTKQKSNEDLTPYPTLKNRGYVIY